MFRNLQIRFAKTGPIPFNIFHWIVSAELTSISTNGFGGFTVLELVFLQEQLLSLAFLSYDSIAQVLFETLKNHTLLFPQSDAYFLLQQVKKGAQTRVRISPFAVVCCKKRSFLFHALPHGLICIFL